MTMSAEHAKVRETMESFALELTTAAEALEIAVLRAAPCAFSNANDRHEELRHVSSDAAKKMRTAAKAFVLPAPAPTPGRDLCSICLMAVLATHERVIRPDDVVHLDCYDRRRRDNVLTSLYPYTAETQQRVNAAFRRS